MQAVLGLVVHDRLSAVGDFGRHFFAAVHGHAVHEDGVGFGVRHDVLRDAVAGEDMFLCSSSLSFMEIKTSV